MAPKRALFLLLLSHHQSEIFCLFFCCFCCFIFVLFGCFVLVCMSDRKVPQTLGIQLSSERRSRTMLPNGYFLCHYLLHINDWRYWNCCCSCCRIFSVKHSLTISNIMGKFVFFFKNSGIICQRFSNYLSLPLIFAFRIHTLPLLIQYSIVCVRNNRGVKSQIRSSPWKAD